MVDMASLPGCCGDEGAPRRLTRGCSWYHRQASPFVGPKETDMVKAVWNGETIAESDDTVVVENNH
jgi:uncharacterized protein (DUF427 family)